MSEIPKIKINKPLNKDYIDGVIFETNYKECLEFWDKYKDNISLFVKDYPQYELEMWEIKMKQNKYYNSEKDWLHDKLFKEE